MIHRVVRAALLVRDAFTGAPFVSGASLRCVLDGQNVRPLWKTGGYLILTDLEPGEHRLLLSCRSYRDQELVFQAGERVWEQEIDMEPADNYPLLRDFALLRLTLKKKKEEPIWAAVPDPVSLRVAQAPEKDASEVRLMRCGPAELLSLPGWFLAADEGKVGPELVHLREFKGEMGIFDVPMSKSHPRGTELFRARRLAAQADGVFEAAFRGGEKIFLFYDGKLKAVELGTGTQEVEWKEG